MAHLAATGCVDDREGFGSGEGKIKPNNGMRGLFFPIFSLIGSGRKLNAAKLCVVGRMKSVNEPLIAFILEANRLSLDAKCLCSIAVPMPTRFAVGGVVVIFGDGDSVVVGASWRDLVQGGDCHGL